MGGAIRKSGKAISRVSGAVVVKSTRSGRRAVVRRMRSAIANDMAIDPVAGLNDEWADGVPPHSGSGNMPISTPQLTSSSPYDAAWIARKQPQRPLIGSLIGARL